MAVAVSSYPLHLFGPVNAPASAQVDLILMPSDARQNPSSDMTLADPSGVSDLISELLGKRCSRVAVGEHKSLSLGFGKLQEPTGKLGIRYGEWEIGTYYSSWRITKDGSVILGKTDHLESYDLFQRSLEAIDFGTIRLIEERKPDVIVRFDTGISIEFMPMSSDDDESFHAFFPDNRYLSYAFRKGFRIHETTGPG